MIVFPICKINIGLYVTGKRNDGFHNLESVFFPVPWNDALEIIESTEDNFTVSGINVDGPPESNLVLKAIQLLRKNYEIPPVQVHLHKSIPTGAGLGGGSSDAASTLVLVNRKFSLEIGRNRLKEFAAELGSDCPFFIDSEPSFVTGRGEFSEPLQLSLKGYYLLIVHPGIHVSTARAFAGIRPKSAAFDLRTITRTPLKDWQSLISNDFEPSVFAHYPEIEELKHRILNAGALYASMSGSGSAVYGIFREEPRVDIPVEYSVKSILI